MRNLAVAGAGALALSILGCASARPPMPTVERVDLERFQGDWYVLASIPTSIERGAHNAVESYRLAADGTIETTFTFRQGSFDGPQKTYRPRGFVRNRETNAEWGMQFVWPFRAEFLVVWLDPEYRTTIVGRTARDHAWIMAREPEIPEDAYARLVAFLAERGYDVSRLEKVPQRWPAPPPAAAR
jgi:apolipoprotein D and lipocalin family protein